MPSLTSKFFIHFHIMKMLTFHVFRMYFVQIISFLLTINIQCNVFA